MPRSLASLPSPARVLVLDAESSDATVAIARAAGARVIVRPWAGFSAARRTLLALADTPWLFMLDADEAFDATLREAVATLEPPAGIAGYRVARTTSLCGKPVRGGGWGGERLLRLVRVERARIETRPAAGGTGDVHEVLAVDGALADLPGELEHDSYPTLAAYREKFDRYTSLEAAGLQPTAGSVARTLARAAVRLPYLYVARGLWRDGWRGAFVAAASALYPVVALAKALRR